MWLIQDLKNRLNSLKSIKNIFILLIYLMIIIAMFLLEIPVTIIINYCYLFLFMYVVQPFISNDMHVELIYKLYFPQKYFICLYIQILLICIIMVPVELLFIGISFNLVFRFLLYTALFYILSKANLNKYTNLILVFMLTEVLSSIMLNY